MDGTVMVDLLKIILINIVLSGDNAVVIALACRNLSNHQQKKAIFWGSFGAIGLRVILTFIAVWLLHVVFVKLIGGLLLVWIAIKLMKGEGEGEHLKGGSNIAEAIRTIIIADFVMSLDNVVAVAGVAGGNIWLIVVGLAISIPLIIWGSQILMKLMNRFPIIIVLGAALLGYTAGEMILNEEVIHEFVKPFGGIWHYILPVALALLVVVLGKLGGGGGKDEDKHKKKEHKLQQN